MCGREARVVSAPKNPNREPCCLEPRDSLTRSPGGICKLQVIRHTSPVVRGIPGRYPSRIYIPRIKLPVGAIGQLFVSVNVFWFTRGTAENAPPRANPANIRNNPKLFHMAIEGSPSGAAACDDYPRIFWYFCQHLCRRVSSFQKYTRLHWRSLCSCTIAAHPFATSAPSDNSVAD